MAKDNDATRLRTYSDPRETGVNGNNGRHNETVGTFTVICRACAYQRQWPTAQEAINDSLRHQTEDPSHLPSDLPSN